MFVVENSMSPTLLIGDPHFTTKNVQDVSIFSKKLEEWLKGNSVGRIVVMGDLLHRHEIVHTVSRNMAEGFIEMIRQYAEVVILVGNHDYINNTQFLSDQHWMNALKQWERVVVVDRPVLIDGVVYCPYVYPGRFVEALNYIDGGEEVWKGAEAIYCHQEFYGCKMGAIRSEIGDVWDETYPMIYSGHIHDKQRPQPNIYYVGSSLQHSYGEKSNKSLLLVDRSKWIEEVFLKVPIKRTLYHTVDSLEKADIVGDDHTRITISGGSKELDKFRKTKRCKDLVKQGIKIHYRKDVVKAITKKASFTELLTDMIKEHPNRDALESLYATMIRECGTV